MILSAFSLRHAADGPEAVYTVEGALVQPGSDQAPPFLLLKAPLRAGGDFAERAGWLG